ncbi:MAG TPA: FtsX-like permease family protein [Candidatus Acidoferrales bacterium]|nr:FtsX-like permease family protein [Candidatus Acidoferrales bacterium]
MNKIASKAVAQPRFRTALLGAFAVIGLILTMIGIYGVISYSVTQRTHEIGLRVALGAQREDILRIVLSQGMALAGVGLAIGIGGALALARFLRSMLFEVKPTDPATFAGVTVLLVTVALFACYIPARRAMRVDPMTALRHE